MPSAAVLLMAALLPAASCFADSDTIVARSGVGFENLEGLILLEARLSGSGRDTTALLVLDTGAGYLGLDRPAAWRLGVADNAGDGRGVELAPRALRRLGIGGLEVDQVAPILLMDADVIRRVTDRPVLGLLGQRPFTGRALWIDYEAESLLVWPNPPPAPGSGRAPDPAAHAVAEPDAAEVATSRRVFRGLLSGSAIALPFRLLGDGKMIVRTQFRRQPSSGEPWLHLVLDTGATQCVLFEPGLAQAVPKSRRWRSVEGLVAPTLIGSEPARLALAPWVAIAAAAGSRRAAAVQGDVECAIVTSPLSRTLAAAVGEPVHGLLGYSFLRNYRVGIDFTHHLVWLDPAPDAGNLTRGRVNVGVQLERSGTAIAVAGVIRNSPADRAGIAAGDHLLSVDGRSVEGFDVVEVARWLDGTRGTRARLVTRRGNVERVHDLVREKLL